MPEQKLGDRIKMLREEQNMTREQLHSRTKILIRYIEALEEGRWDLLPGQVYLKPFVKNIAEALGVDYRELYALIDRVKKKPEPIVEEPREKGFDYRWIVVILMAGLVALIIFLFEPMLSEKSAPVDQSARLVVPETQKNLLKADQFSSNLDLDKNIASAIGYHTIELAAIDSVWLLLTAANDTLFMGVLDPGRRLRRESAEPPKLLLGRINSLNIIYDGRKLNNEAYVHDRRRIDFADQAITDYEGGSNRQ